MSNTFFADWTVTGLTAERAGDSASFQRADTLEGLAENIARYEAPFVVAAEADRCADAKRVAEEHRVATRTAVNEVPPWTPQDEVTV